MSTTTTRQVAAEDDLRAVPEDGRKYELVDGEIRVSPAGECHSQPGDRPRQVFDKVGEYLEAGVRLVWVIEPRHERAAVYRSISDVRELGRDDVLEGEDVIPGLRFILRDVL